MPWQGIGAASLGFTAGLIDGGLNWASSSYNYNQQKRMMQRQFEYQKELLALQQGWSAKMSNTAHQREVADLRKAGLNPILSATGGQGASTPAVSAASVGTGFSPGLDLGSPASKAVSSALEAYKTSKQGKAIDADIDATNATTDKTKSEKDLIAAQIEETKARTEETKARTSDINQTLPHRVQSLIADNLRKDLENKYADKTLEQRIDMASEALEKMRNDKLVSDYTSQFKHAQATLEKMKVAAANGSGDYYLPDGTPNPYQESLLGEWKMASTALERWIGEQGVEIIGDFIGLKKALTSKSKGSTTIKTNYNSKGKVTGRSETRRKDY